MTDDAQSLAERRGTSVHATEALLCNLGKLHFFSEIYLRNEFFLDYLKFFVLIFSIFDCIFLENAISIFYLGGRFRITIYASEHYF